MRLERSGRDRCDLVRIKRGRDFSVVPLMYSNARLDDGYNYGSTSTRLLLDSHSTAVQPRYDHSATTFYDRPVLVCCAAA